MMLCSPDLCSKQGKLINQTSCSGLYSVWHWKSPRTKTANFPEQHVPLLDFPHGEKDLKSYALHLLGLCFRLDLQFCGGVSKYIF